VHHQSHLRRSSLGIPHPADWRFFSQSYSCFSYLFRTAFWSSRLFEMTFIIKILLVPHASRIVAYMVLTWLLSFW